MARPASARDRNSQLRSLVDSLRLDKSESVEENVNIPEDLVHEALRVEYQDIGHNWRFFVGTRFLTLGYFATLNSALLAAAGWILNKEAITQKGGILAAIAVAGAVCTLAVALMEYRTYCLFQVCLKRGVQLENLLQLWGGQYHLFKESERGYLRGLCKITHTRAICVIYLVMITLWVLIFFYRGHFTDQVHVNDLTFF